MRPTAPASLAVLFGLAPLLGPAGLASAQGSAPGSEIAVQAALGAESPELRAMREIEAELFGGQPLAQVEPPGVVLSDGPGAVTSDSPPARTERARSSQDLDWMRGLTLPDIPVRWDDRVLEYLEYFRDNPRGRRLIRAWLRRVDRYRPMIERALREQGLPRDILFVAMVESGFDPTARSHAGAAGMWQFVRRTGEELGLTVNHWVDLRLDPQASTAAAGRYLHMLHERFGTWELTFAAYNMGYGALLRSIRKYNTNDYWELSHLEAGLPFETNLYVSKIIACAIVAHNRERFGFADIDPEAPIEWDTVEVPGGVSLSVIARAAGTDTATIRSLNPAFRRGRTPPGADARPVHIPRGASVRFAARWARVRPGRPTHLPHVIRFGETLGDLARERGTTEASLRALNELSADEPILVGMVLLAPVTRTPARGEQAERPVISVPAAPTVVPGRRRIFYRVARHDTADSIARFFRVRVDEVRAWNGIDPHARLQPGMYLQLFVRPQLDLTRAITLSPDEVTMLVVGSEEFFAYHEGQNGRTRFRYEVQAGDTLSSIGQRFGIRVSSLSRINQIARNHVLHPGDALVVYAEDSRVPAAVRAANQAAQVASGSAPAVPAAPAIESPAEEAAELSAAETTETETETEGPAEETADADATDAPQDAVPDGVPAPDEPAEVHPG